MCKRLHFRADTQTEVEPSIQCWPSVCICVYPSTLTLGCEKERSLGKRGEELPLL